MSAALKQAAVDEALELSYLFRQNAALSRGLPDCKRLSAILTPDEPPVPQEPPVVNITNQLPTPAEMVKDSPSPGLGAASSVVGQSLLRRAAPLILAAVATGISLPVGISSLVNYFQEAPVVTAPTEQQKDTNLLQYLQDNGYHLEDKSKWQMNP